MDRIVSFFAESLSPLGYRRKGQRWSIAKADFIVTLRLIKSRFGAECFVDIELTLLGSNKPDVATRIDYWIDEVGISFEEADPSVESKISDFLHMRAILSIERLDSDYLRSAEGLKLLKIAYVTEAASKFFSVDDRS